MKTYRDETRNLLVFNHKASEPNYLRDWSMKPPSLTTCRCASSFAEDNCSLELSTTGAHRATCPSTHSTGGQHINHVENASIALLDLPLVQKEDSIDDPLSVSAPTTHIVLILEGHRTIAAL